MVAQSNRAHNFRDVTGQQFGRLTAVSFSGRRGRRTYWRCRCECGTEKDVELTHLTSGHTRSCGCLAREITSRAKRIHGMSRTPEHTAWYGMYARCYVPTTRHYENYGGRGIRVCGRWLRSFLAFYADMGPRPSPNHSLDRIDNDADYGPSNCRWAVRKVQQNNRRVTRFVEWQGKRYAVSELAGLYGIQSSVLRARLNMGWTVDKALSQPVRNHLSRKGVVV